MQQQPHLVARPASLWDSLCEGRPPLEREVESVAAKIWREVFRGDAGLAWSQVEIGSPLHRKSVAAARAALGAAPATLAH